MILGCGHGKRAEEMGWTQPIFFSVSHVKAAHEDRARVRLLELLEKTVPAMGYEHNPAGLHTVLTDFAAYPQWTSVISRVRTDLHPDAAIRGPRMIAAIPGNFTPGFRYLYVDGQGDGRRHPCDDRPPRGRRQRSGRHGRGRRGTFGGSPARA